MADRGSIDVDYGLDASQANAELERLRQSAAAVGADLLNSQKILETRVTRMLGTLAKAMKQVEAGEAGFTRRVQKQEALFGQAVGQAGRGSYRSQINNAAANAVIADIKNQGKVLEARVQDAVVQTYGRVLRNTTAAVAARMRAEEVRVDRLIRANRSELLEARGRLEADRDRRTVRNSAPEVIEARGRLEERRIQRQQTAASPEVLSAQARIDEARTRRTVANAAPEIIAAVDRIEESRSLRRLANSTPERLGVQQRLDEARAERQRLQSQDEILAARARLDERQARRTIRSAAPEQMEIQDRLDDYRSRRARSNANPELLAAREVLTEARNQRVIAGTTADQIARRTRLEEARERRIAENARPENIASRAALDALRTQRTRRDATPEQLEAARRLDESRGRQRLTNSSPELIAARELLAEAKNQRLLQMGTPEQIAGRVRADELRRERQQINNSPEMLEARARIEAERNRRTALRASPELMQARETIAARRTQDTLSEARNGRAATSMNFTRERFDVNGGADMMGLQGRIMANGIAISAAWNAARGLASFIVDLDKELRNFQAISASSNVEMATMKQRLIELSATVPFTTLEMAKGATMLAQVGLSTREVGDSLGAVAQFATASGSDLSQAVDVVTSSLTAYNLETSQTGDVANTFTSALNLSKLSVDRLVVGMNYVGPTAAAMGISLQETVAILGALSQSGIRASTAATGARALMVDLQKPSEKFLGILKNMGLSQRDVSVESEGFLTVMQRLSDAGFGAAQAYEAFELRAAASFVALSNNTELAYKLQRAFTLSNAAVEASAVQMQSLSNTFNNFYSVVGTSAYTAFEPLMNLLQQVFQHATSVLSVLSEYPGVLKAVAVAATMVGGVTFFATFGALLRGLTQMIPLFTTYSVAAGTASAATGVFSGALTGLFAIMKGHPFIMIASLILTAATAIYSFTTASETAADRIDRLNGNINSLKGDTDAADKKLASLEQTINNVLKQKEALDKNPLMREAKILEIQQQFKELGSSIQASTSSVTDLIRELHNLQGAEERLRSSALGAQLAEQHNLEAEQRRQLDEYFTKGGNRSDMVNPAWSFNGLGYFDKRYNNLANGEQRDVALMNDTRQRVSSTFNNPSIDRIFRAITGDRSAIDINDPQGTGSLAYDLQRTISQLQGESSRTTNEKAKANIEQSITFLQEMANRFAELNTRITKLASISADIDLTSDQARLSGIKTRPTAAAMPERISKFEASLLQETDAIARMKSTEERVEAYEALQERLGRGLETFNYQVDTILREAQAVDPSVTREQVESVVNGMMSTIAQTQLKITTDAANDSEQFVKDLDKQTKKQTASLKRQITLLARRRNRATSVDDVNDLEKQINDLEKEIGDLTLAAFNAKKKYLHSKSPDAAGDDQEALDGAMTELSEAIQDQAEAAVENRTKLIREDLKLQQNAVQDSAKALSKKIDEATQLLKNTRPGEAMDRLKASIQSMIDELARLGQTDMSLQFQQDSIAVSNEPIPAKQADRAAKAMQHYMSMGYSKAGASAITGNLMVESRMDPTALGDWDPDTKKHTAYGMAQWRFERQAELRRFGPNPGDFNTQLNFVDHELKRDYPELYRQLQSGEMGASALSKKFMSVYERPKNDPNVNHVDRRMGYSKELAGQDFDANQQVVDQKRTDAVEAEQKATTRAVVASMDSQIKNANRQLGMLSGQLTLSGTTESVEKITASVRKWHGDIMKAELEKFDKVNAKAATEDPQGIAQQREELQERLQANLAKDIAKVQEEYYKAAETEIDAPVRQAKLELETAQRPEFASRYTGNDIIKLEENVRLAERESILQRILMVEQQIAQAKQAQATAVAGSPEYDAATLREAELKARLVELTNAKNAADQATANQGPSVAGAIQSANDAWARQAGILDSTNQLVPLAQQVGDAWSQILGSISSGMSTLFTDLASGTMSAGEAFKKFGLTVIQTMMDIVAKALANQILGSILGVGGAPGAAGGAAGGGGILGTILGGLVGTPMALGGGVRGAATGEYITGGVPNRDSVLRRVMPGEFIMRKSAVDMVGKGALDNMNNMANRSLSTNDNPIPTANDNSQMGGVVNVWVISPDQQPPMGPNDVVASIADNIQRRGTIKQLIKQVQMGSI